MYRHPKTRYFFDCEFVDDGHTVDLLSIGIVADDGREFYAVSTEADQSRASEWVKINVLPYLGEPKMDRNEMRAAIQKFVNEGKHFPEFWGYFSMSDWLCLTQLFGTIMQLPPHWPQFCLDLAQECYQRGIMKPKQAVPLEGQEHNALDDARWTMKLHNFIFPPAMVS